MQQHPCEPYAACPYCLTEIEETLAEQNNKSEKTIPETILHKEKTTRNKDKPTDCQYHFGYLSEREKKERIPDDCLSCTDILECMLRKMRQ